jgi:hypothetical protein
MPLNVLTGSSYNQRERDLSAFEIGWRRSCSVVAGVVWATLISNFWWPFAARTELRMALSESVLMCPEQTTRRAADIGPLQFCARSGVPVLAPCQAIQRTEGHRLPGRSGLAGTGEHLAP